MCLHYSLEEIQYDDSTLTANEADEEDEVDDCMFHAQQPSLRRYHRKGMILLKNSESHTDDSIDDSDGSGVTTLTSTTTCDLAFKRQQFRNHHNRRHTTVHHHHARYKTHLYEPPQQSHVASGLKLAQSQAMAVAGFLPFEPLSLEKQPLASPPKKSNMAVARHQRPTRLTHFSVGSESMAGTDTTSLDVDNSNLSVNRATSAATSGRSSRNLYRQHRYSYHGPRG